MNVTMNLSVDVVLEAVKAQLGEMAFANVLMQARLMQGEKLIQNLLDGATITTDTFEGESGPAVQVPEDEDGAPEEAVEEV